MIYSEAMHMEKKVIEKVSSVSLKQDIKKIKPIIGKGEVNQIFIAEGKTKKIILRINTKSNRYKEFKKEEWCIKKAKIKGVAVPKILKIGKYKNSSYMIYEFIEGKNDKEIKNRKHVWFTLGNYAKRINSIKVRGYGPAFSSDKRKFLESWDKYIDYNIASLNKKDKLKRSNVYGDKQLPIIKKYFADLKNKKHKIGLAHNDLSLRNVVVDKTNKVFLIDWGCAEANIVPHSEFVEILGWGHMGHNDPTNEEINYFLKGYGISQKRFVRLKKEISKFLLVVSFDKLKWAIDNNPKKIREYSRIAKKRIKYALKINS